MKNVFKIPVAVIQKGPLFLFQRRKKDPYKNYLGLLGGKVETGENLEKALIREVFEESSLIVKDLYFIGIVSEFFYTKSELYKVELSIYKVVTKGEILANNREGDLFWIEQHEFELFRDEFIATDWLVVKRVIDDSFENFEVKVFENNSNYSVISGF
jgi:8-oxo-dGTP diphosphatase